MGTVVTCCRPSPQPGSCSSGVCAAPLPPQGPEQNPCGCGKEQFNPRELSESPQCDYLLQSYCQRHSPAGEGAFGDGGVLEQALAAVETASRKAVSIPGLQQDSYQQVTLASGSLMLWLRLPGSGPYDPSPVLTFNGNGAAPGAPTEFGTGWSARYRETLEVSNDGGTTIAQITAGDGSLAQYVYELVDGGYAYVPANGCLNSLRVIDSANMLVTQPDGFQKYFQTYGAGSGSYRLVSMVNPQGVTWNLNYNSSSGCLASIAGPFSRTTYVYSGTPAKLLRIFDATGRITTFTVNVGGLLTSVLTPGLCQTQFVYDGSSNLTAKVDPAGTRTTYSYNGSVLKAIEMPDGTRTTITAGYPYSKVKILNAVGGPGNADLRRRDF